MYPIPIAFSDHARTSSDASPILAHALSRRAVRRRTFAFACSLQGGGQSSWVHVFLAVMGLLFYRYLAWKTKKYSLSLKEFIDALSGIRIAIVKDKKSDRSEIVVEEKRVRLDNVFLICIPYLLGNYSVFCF